MAETPSIYPVVKRALDITAAAVGLILSAPALGIIAIVVRVSLGSPVLFRQNRVGRDGRAFTLVKFRSMRTVESEAGLVTDADRLTRIGSVIRSTSVDELPSLVNVLRGDMSVVGPRPLLVDYLERYTPEEARRHDVRPGITGLAQVSGRNEVPWDERLRLDVLYVDRVSVRLDLAVILRTLVVVARRTGVTTSGHATTTEFRPTHSAIGSQT